MHILFGRAKCLLFTYSTTREQCCSAAVGEWFCKNGTELAKEKGTCHGLFPKGEHWETQMSKVLFLNVNVGSLETSLIYYTSKQDNK